jgi:hypothetical protein
MLLVARIKPGSSVLMAAASSLLVGCADVWGFQELTMASDSGQDATADGGSAGPAPGVADGADAELREDAIDDADGPERDRSDGEGGAARPDAGDAASPGNPVPCRQTCGGCCDTNGNCLGGRSLTACGGSGMTCVDCSTTSCPVLDGPCCAGGGGCGCQLLSLGLTQCQ